MANAASSRPRSASEVGELTRGERVARALHGAFCRDASRGELTALAAGKIQGWGPPVSATHIYAVEGSVLRLVASAGTAIGKTPIQLVTEDPSADEVETVLREIPELADAALLIVPIHLHDLVLGAVVIVADPAQPLGDELERDVRQSADALAALL